MHTLDHLLASNRAWARSVTERDPKFFQHLAEQQTPSYLWIGCSDSRVPATEITGLMPGEIFVHRNVANLVVQTDLNCLSVIQFAVEALRVRHFIVCGHYGCGGVSAALRDTRLGLADNWLRAVRDVMVQHAALLSAVEGEEQRLNLLCELNIIEQVRQVCNTTIVRGAWERGQELAVHGWIYALADGLLQDLGLCVTDADELPEAYARAVQAYYSDHGETWGGT